MIRNGGTWVVRASLIFAIGFSISGRTAEHVDPGVTQTAGGTLEFRWNRSQLGTLGFEVSGPINANEAMPEGFDRFDLTASSGVTVRTHGNAVQQLTDGLIFVRGGYVLSTPQGSIDLRDFSLRLRPGSPPVFDLVTGHGETPFFADNAMVESARNGAGVSISTMDLRLSPLLAQRLGKSAAAGALVGSLRLSSDTRNRRASRAVEEEACPASTRWPGQAVPGHPGQLYRVDAFLEGFVVQITGCRDCTGPEGQGEIKLTPTTILRNSVNDGGAQPTVTGDQRGTSTASFSADIPWRSKFSRDCPPYGNDQHPYLVWNFYRVTAAGQLEQLARSGLKHGHTAQNSVCAKHPQSNHVLGLGCEDVYGAGDNDAPDALGPRAEVIPSTGQWARCGSIYDPQCVGKPLNFKNYDDFTYRLLVPETIADPTAHPGDRYFVEAWYVVRDDIDVYNTMTHRQVTFHWHLTNAMWTIDEGNQVQLGPVIDAWVDPQRSREGGRNTEVVTPHGRIKVAVQTTPLGPGRIRYDYVVMNVDYSSTTTKGKEPNLRIASSRGILAFEVPVSVGVAVSEVTFADADRDPGNDWHSTRQGGAVKWQATSANELTWGTLYRFSFVADRQPGSAAVMLTAGGIAPQSIFKAEVLAPESTAPTSRASPLRH